jgi:pimeloyl-ACP methyl ester carboxylesterase
VEKLVFLPGLGARGKIWDHQVKHLRDIAECDVLPLEQQESLSEMVDFVLNSVPGKFSLVGHSMGGWVAQKIAASMPQRIAKLILLNTCSHFDQTLLEKIRKAKKDIETGEFAKVLHRHLEEIVYYPRIADSQFMTALKKLHQDATADLYLKHINAICKDCEIPLGTDDIRAPTLIIHSREDSLFSLNNLKALQSLIPKSALTIIEECGHMTPFERPQALTTLIRLWIANPHS